MLRMYSVFDKEIKKYSNPLFFEQLNDHELQDLEAIRAFKTQLFDRRNLIAMFPDKYELCYIGKFDEFSGTFETGTALPVVVITGDDAIKEIQNEPSEN